MVDKRFFTRAFVGAMMSVTVAGAAVAQSMTMPFGGSSTMSDDEKAKKAEQEKAYQSSLRKIPDQKAKSDPWGNVRGSDTGTTNKNQSSSK
jgi:uncharacterized membrane protein